MPRSDQVPEESTAARAVRSGAATKAEAVSCAATVHTGTPGAPAAASECSASTGPRSVPGSTAHRRTGAREAERGHDLARPLPAPRVEEARRRGGGDLVGELAREPQAEEVRHEPDPFGGPEAPAASAINWKIVLIAIVWMPVTA